MASISVNLRNIEGSSAAVGWAGSHTVLVDPPEGTVGGFGIGFNGGELLALAIGGCFCNGIRYLADELRVSVGKIQVNVTLVLRDDASLVTEASLEASCETLDDSDPGVLLAKAKETSTVGNSVQLGFPVTYNFQ